MPDKPSFRVNSRDYPIVTMDQWDLGEICDAEQFFGVEYGAEKPSARTTVACLYISMKRVDPQVRVEDVRALPQETIIQLAEQMKELQRRAKAADARPPKSDEKPSASAEPSPLSSETPSDHSDSDPAPTGDLGSDTTSASDLTTSLA